MPATAGTTAPLAMVLRSALPSPAIARLVVVAFVVVALAAKKLVEVALVKTAVEGVVAPMGVLFMVPAEIVRLSETYASMIGEPCHTPAVTVPKVDEPLTASVLAEIVGAESVVPSKVKLLLAVTASAVALV